MRAGRNVSVRVRIYVWIDPQSDRRTQCFTAGDIVDVVQLGLALDVETENALVQCVLNLVS